MDMQKIQSELQVLNTKYDSAEIGTAKIIANLYGIYDLTGDIVELGACAETIRQRKPLVLDNHQRDSVTRTCALCTSVYEVNRDELMKLSPATIAKFDQFGVKGIGVTGALIAEIQFDRTDDISLAVWNRLRKGWINSASIGFTVNRSSQKRVTLNNGKTVSARMISDITLFEISLVNFPANTGSTVINVRSQTDKNQSVRELDDLLNTLQKQQLMDYGYRSKNVRDLEILQLDTILKG